MQRKFIGLLTILALMIMWVPASVGAAALTNLSDTMTSHKASTVSNHTIEFDTPSGVAGGENITITFPAGFDLSSLVEDDIDVADDTVDLTTDTTASGATWGVDITGQVITITSGTGTIAAGSTVEVEIGTNATSSGTGANQITNHATPSTYQIDIAGTFGDTGSITIPILSDDEVAVTAEVGQTLSFSISDNTIEFGTLSASTVTYADDAGGNGSTETAAHTMTIGTNASSGYTITYSGATLTSGSDTINDTPSGIATGGTTGQEQFAMAAATDGDATIATTYRQASSEYAFDEDSASTPITLVSETVASADETISMYYLANIASLTEAGNYSTAIKFSATANF